MTTCWQPIETAPVDGTLILLAAIVGDTYKVADGSYTIFASSDGKEDGAWVWPYILTNPTHWQPMPAKT